MAMISRRKRDPTFAASEKMALVEIIEKYSDKIENKKTDVATISSKNQAWREIADEFNAVSSVHPRQWTVLRNCWENMKKRAKQQSKSILPHVQRQPQQLAQDLADSQNNPRTPLRVHAQVPASSALTTTSCRRPILLRPKERDNLKRVASLTMANEHAQEEHEIKIKILKLQEAQEELKLKREQKKFDLEQEIQLRILKFQEEQELQKTKQEVLKTELLELQIRNIKDQ